MAYMTRLGLWGTGQAFPEFTDFINAVERRGVGAMEIVAMDMKVGILNSQSSLWLLHPCFHPCTPMFNGRLSRAS